MTYKTTRLLAAASARVKERLQQRDRLGLLRGAADASVGSPTRIVAQLSAILGVDATYLRPEETLREVLRVHRSELPADLQDLFPALGLQDFVDPFALEILDMVEREIRRDRTKIHRKPFVPTPTNEDEWVTRLLDMTIAEFVEALA
jgi:hypothetical protein